MEITVDCKTGVVTQTATSQATITAQQQSQALEALLAAHLSQLSTARATIATWASGPTPTVTPAVAQALAQLLGAV